MISKNELEVGMKVAYFTEFTNPQIGTVTSWNDRFVFVNYGTGSQATRYEDLGKVPETTPVPVENKHRIWRQGVLVTPDQYGNSHMALAQYDRVHPGEDPDHQITEEEMQELLKKPDPS